MSLLLSFLVLSLIFSTFIFLFSSIALRIMGIDLFKDPILIPTLLIVSIFYLVSTYIIIKNRNEVYDYLNNLK